MLELRKRLSLMTEIVRQKPRLGKTAMMKSIFILQQVYKVPLGYDYGIYTYGPYSSSVMEDIQLAADYGAISIETVHFPSGLGYELKPTEQAKKTIDLEAEFVNSHHESLSEVIRRFGDKSAKELELSSTIIYMYSNYHHNGWNNSKEAISKSVQNIKPHFDIDMIRTKYTKLDEDGILKKST